LFQAERNTEEESVEEQKYAELKTAYRIITETR